MKILGLFKKDSDAKYPINDALKKIKSGDETLREKVLADYKPFIIKVVSAATNKFVEIENSDEYSIGLIAFNEAINSFNEERNHNFLTYSEMVIKRRIIDYRRSNIKNDKVLPFTYFNQDEDSNVFEERYLSSDSFFQFENIEVKEEIQMLKSKLNEFGITIMELVVNSPKHSDSMRFFTKIARTIADDDVLFDKLHRYKMLPIKELLRLFNVHRRTIEKHRKFIIAVSLILRSNIEVSKQYVKNVEKDDK
ncbi:MAG: RNA polymerase sigma-I factor [Clostridia bacterium]|nr:RNA polymerase sigma-I factor [Clostridia bacterium]